METFAQYFMNTFFKLNFSVCFLNSSRTYKWSNIKFFGVQVIQMSNRFFGIEIFIYLSCWIIYCIQNIWTFFRLKTLMQWVGGRKIINESMHYTGRTPKFWHNWQVKKLCCNMLFLWYVGYALRRKQKLESGIKKTFWNASDLFF